jgi:dienelactone hydrolase
MATALTPYLERNPPDPAPLASAYFIRAVSIPRRGPMRVAPWAFLLAIGLIASLLTGAASAGALVEFPNVSERSPARLLGYLARPDTGVSKVLGSHSNDARPYASVVVLHGCAGISGVSVTIADQLAAQGYVALTVDSLGPRGIASRCGSGGIDQAFDAYAALRFLSQLDFVDPARVALIGYSMGGSAALYAVDRLMAAQYFQERFRAAIAFYPACAIATAATMTAPTLILIGEADDWTPADQCPHLVAHSRPDSEPIALTVYPGAYHGFDVRLLQPGVRYLGHWLEYNEPAAKDAEERVRAFLAAHGGGTSPGEPTAR